MSVGVPQARDVPHLFDVILDGKGYIFLRTIDTSLPFRVQRATYGVAKTFVARSNQSGRFEDNQQDFFFTESQNKWSGGEDQKFFRGADDTSNGRYWKGSGVDISIPGQISLLPAAKSLTFGASVGGSASHLHTSTLLNRLYTTSSTNLFEVDSTGAIVDRGAHGGGGLLDALASDGQNLFMGQKANTLLRRSSSAFAFSTFNTNTIGHSSIIFLNNTVYSTDGQALTRYSTAGVQSNLFPWHDGVGGTLAANSPLQLVAYGGKILILRPGIDTGGAPELWIYDGSSTLKLAELPKNFAFAKPGLSYLGGACVANGILFIPGVLMHSDTVGKSAIYYYANGTLDLLWASDHFADVSTGNTVCAPFDNGVVFTDWVDVTLRYYDMGTGAVSTLAPFTTAASEFYLGSSGSAFLLTRTQAGATFYPDSVYATTGYVRTSLFDFDSSLPKNFRSVIVEFDSATDGDGGSVDVGYQINGLDGSYTTTTGVVSGEEHLYSGLVGRSICFKITLNKGTSTRGPILKRVSVRAAPNTTRYPVREFIVDCSGKDGLTPVILNDNETAHPLDGLQQATNLKALIDTMTPFTMTDRFGTYSTIECIPEDCEIIEVSPEEYIARMHVRAV